MLKAVRTFKASGNLIMTKQEKKIIISSFCGVISRLLKSCGGRWKGIRDLSGITLNLAFPLLENSMVDRSITESDKKGEIFWSTTTLEFEVITLIRYNLCNRLSLDSMFLPHLKERSNARTGGGVDKNSTDKKAHAVVEGQWVGGTTAGQTPAAIAAAQRLQLQLAGDDVLCECDMNSLKLCLSLMTESSDNVISKNIREEDRVLSSLSVFDTVNSADEDKEQDGNKNENERKNTRKESENRIIMIENAVIAVHSLLLGRGREAAGVFILAALSEEEGEKVEEDNKSDIKIIFENNKGIDDSAVAVVDNSQEKQKEKEKEKQKEKNSTNNDQNKSKIASKLQKIISNSEDENKSSGLIRLVAAKVIDVWYSVGGGMSKKLLDAEDHSFEEEDNDGNIDANAVDGEVQIDTKEGDENKDSKNDKKKQTNTIEGNEKINNSDSAQEGMKIDEDEDEEVKETRRCEKIFQLLMGMEIAEEIVSRFKATGKEEKKVERGESEGREDFEKEKQMEIEMVMRKRKR